MSAPVIPLDTQDRETKPRWRWRGLVFVLLALLVSATIWLV